MTPLEKAHSAHQAAMELAEDAFLAERRGDRVAAGELNRRAFLLETEAAEALADRLDVEPTRSILYRSAATLALRCGEVREAQRLATKGFEGEPPEEIADELRAVLEEAILPMNVHLAAQGDWAPPAERAAWRTGGKGTWPAGGKWRDGNRVLFFNGVSPKGRYLTPPMTVQDLVERVQRTGGERPPDWMVQWNQDYSLQDPRRKPILKAKRKWDLAETGWGVIFAPGIDRRVRAALDELLEHRKSQATKSGYSHYFKVCEYRPGESTREFLERHHVSAGTRGDPEHLPYYLLLVGDPEALPFNFQYELDVSYAVGRICFDQPKDYLAYARSVVRAETRRPMRPQSLGFFGPAHPNDESTEATSRRLLEPLANSFKTSRNGWNVLRAIGPEATKDRLRGLLGGVETPALLMAACHGLGFDGEDDRQLEGQGALVCQDWPGPYDEEGVGEDQFFAGADVPDSASLHGLMALFVACYGVGTPPRDNFDLDTYGNARPIAPRSFMARLPQRLLSHPEGGALAVVGHIDRAWTSSFTEFDGDEGIGSFRELLGCLLDGETIGWAMEYLNQPYAELAVELSNLEERLRYRQVVDEELFARLWMKRNDARNYVVFGDPAVRLPGVGEPR